MVFATNKAVSFGHIDKSVGVVVMVIGKSAANGLTQGQLTVKTTVNLSQ